MAIYSSKEQNKLNVKSKAYQLLKSIFEAQSKNIIDIANGYSSKNKSNDVVWEDKDRGVVMKFNHALNSVDVYLQNKLVNTFF